MDEDDGQQRLFICKDEIDFHKVALIVLRERYNSGKYPTTKSARTAYQNAMDEIANHEVSFVVGDKTSDGTLAGQSRRKRMLDDYRSQVEDRYLPDIIFAERLEELLAKPFHEGLDMRWIFDDGSSVNLAWMLLIQRRKNPGEGFTIAAPKSL